MKIARLLTALLPAALASGPVPAKDAIAHIVWGEGGAFHHAAAVAPGRFVEVCGEFTAGQKVAWAFEAAAPVDFNIHYHAGKDTVFPARIAQTAQSRDTLAVAVAAGYCWMWTNKGSEPVRVSVSLQR